MEGPSPAITVAICTKDRADMVADALRSVLDQELAPASFEVVVVDDGSTDATSEVVGRIAKEHGAYTIRYIRQEHQGLSVARNRAIEEAATDLVCFIDDDAVAVRGWTRAIDDGRRAFPDAWCYTGRILLRLEGRAPRTCGREAFAGFLDAGDEPREIDLIKGGNMFLKRSTVERVGGFKPALVTRGDEDEWFKRVRAVGGTAVYLPDALIYHRRTAPELKASVLLRTRFRWGIAQVQYKREAGEPFSYLDELVRIGFGLGHAMKRLCFGGLMQTATALGALWAALRGELRRSA